MLRDLYYGRVNPWAMKLPKDDEMSTFIRRSNELEKEVNESLDDAGREKFTEFLKLDCEFGDAQQFLAFRRGFRIAARLILESLMDEPADT